MYTNIKTGQALHHIGQFALEHNKHLTVPLAVLIDALRQLLTNNFSNLGTLIGSKKWGQK